MADQRSPFSSRPVLWMGAVALVAAAATMAVMAL